MTNIDDGSPDDTYELIFYRGDGETVNGSTAKPQFMNNDLASAGKRSGAPARRAVLVRLDSDRPGQFQRGPQGRNVVLRETVRAV